MAGAAGALYEPLIERRVEAIPSAVDAFLRLESPDELWKAIARFAVLAWAPSQHAKRAVMAARAAHDVREETGDAWIPLLVECARYAAESRPPWSEPPILDDLELDESALAGISDGDALLMLDTALALEPLLGSKGRAALLRMALGETDEEPTVGSLEVLVDQAIASRGAVDTVRNVFIRIVQKKTQPVLRDAAWPMLRPYPLARDYASTLIAHAFAPRLEYRTREFLECVHDNLEHGENYAAWSFA